MRVRRSPSAWSRRWFPARSSSRALARRLPSSRRPMSRRWSSGSPARRPRGHGSRCSRPRSRPCARGARGGSCAHVDFGILGPLQALEGEGEVALGGGKQRALLALLLLHANETLSADRVIDQLWGERPPATAGKALQVHISNLRKALGGGDGIVLTRDRGYELRLEPEQLDARRFERLVAEGRDGRSAGRPERAAGALESGLALWRGPPLADLAYEGFARAEAGRLDELRVAAEEMLIDAKLALGRHDEVVEQCEGLVAAHPYRERLRAQRMTALYRAERQAAALQAYQDARRQLVDELGIEPGERLRELEAAILAQDPGLQLAGEPEPARSTLIRREAELAELGAVVEDVLAGQGRVVLIGGEAGI